MSNYQYEKATHHPSQSSSPLTTTTTNYDYDDYDDYEDDEDTNNEEEPSCTRMFFTKLAERIGLLDVVAPRTHHRRRRSRGDASNPNDAPSQPPSSQSLSPKEQPNQQPSPADLQVIRRNRLKAQWDAEQRAQQHDQYAPNQRAKYHYRADDIWYDAIVVAIHLDDGPNHPYYVSTCTLVVLLNTWLYNETRTIHCKMYTRESN